MHRIPALLIPAILIGACALPAQAAPAPPAATPEGELAAAVAADWPKYDQAGKSHLTRPEFSFWLASLRAASGKKEDPLRVQAWADGAFPGADADTDGQVTPEEFTAYLKSKMRKSASADR